MSLVLDRTQTLEAGPARTGGKAHNLARLVALGVSVPEFVVVPAEAFRAHLSRSAAPARIGDALVALADGSGRDVIAAVSAPIRHALAAAPLAAELTRDLAAAVGRLGPGPFAVRSSMVGEDSASHSFAGQLESYLRVDATRVAAAVLDCWASAFGERAVAYSLRVGLDLAAARVGVVVQRMVDSDVAGVVFTANPSNGRRDETVLTAAWGQGEGVVSGMCDTDEFLWRDGREVAARVAHKDRAVRPVPGGSGVTTEPVAPELRDVRCLDRGDVERICATAGAIATAYGCPQDVEWAVADGQLWVLQTRPVTALAEPAPDTAGREVIWDNSNIQESYCGVTTPLTFSFASRAYAIVYETTFRMLGTPDATLQEFGPVFRNLLGFLHGRVYYNLSAWYRGCLLMPSVQHTKEDMERMMGVDDPVDIVQDEDLGLLDRLRRVPRLVGAFARLAPQLARCDAHIAEFDTRFARVTAGVDRDALAEAGAAELVSTLDVLDTELLAQWHAPILNDGRVLQASGNLRRFLTRHVPDEEPDALVAGLLAGIDGIASVEPTRLLLDAAAAIRTDTAAQAAFVQADPALVLAALAADAPAVHALLQRYVALYGDRVMGELKLETVTLREDPAFLVGVLRNYLERPDLTAATLTERERRHFEGTMESVEAALPPRLRGGLRSRVDKLRHAVKMREHLRLCRTVLFGLYRDVYRAIGVRLTEAGRLDDARDVFHLTVDEVPAFVDGRAVTSDLRALVALRKREFEANRHVDLPHRFTTRGIPYVGAQFGTASGAPQRDGTTDPAPTTLRGTGCYPGVVDATVRLVLSPDDELDVNGRILATVRTDPGWAPLFPTCSGLLVERGSTLSHSAVVARELGIPAIVGVPNLTRIVTDGERVRMDGAAGTVVRHPAAGESP